MNLINTILFQSGAVVFFLALDQTFSLEALRLASDPFCAVHGQDVIVMERRVFDLRTSTAHHGHLQVLVCFTSKWGLWCGEERMRLRREVHDYQFICVLLMRHGYGVKYKDPGSNLFCVVARLTLRDKMRISIIWTNVTVELLLICIKELNWGTLIWMGGLWGMTHWEDKLDSPRKTGWMDGWICWRIWHWNLSSLIFLV